MLSVLCSARCRLGDRNSTNFVADDPDTAAAILELKGPIIAFQKQLVGELHCFKLSLQGASAHKSSASTKSGAGSQAPASWCTVLGAGDELYSTGWPSPAHTVTALPCNHAAP